MARPKRTLAQVELEDAQAEQERATRQAQQAGNGGGVAEISGKPKRVRKQTQRYASTTTVTSLKRTSKKTTVRATRKGKNKAIAKIEEPGQGSEGREEPTDEPPKKKARTKKGSTAAPKEEKEEKRGAQFRDHCPQATWERAERVQLQRFFMIDRKREGKELKEEFKVLGSTGNVYTVVVGHSPKCDCPDNRRGNHCKHIMFIFLKVLVVPMSSHVWYQKALLTSELETIFSQAPEAPNSVTNPRVREAFLRATGQLAESSTAAMNSKKRIPGEEDDCPICYDTMYQVSEAQLTFCEECGNALHKECFTEYEKSARKGGRDVTCVWCRSEWGVAPTAKPASSSTHHRGFVNLAGVVPGVDGRRDTTTYHHPYYGSYV